MQEQTRLLNQIAQMARDVGRAAAGRVGPPPGGRAVRDWAGAAAAGGGARAPGAG